MINCPYENKEGCDNNKGRGFKHSQALKMHIFYKHKNLTKSEKLESKGIGTTREKEEVKEEPILKMEKPKEEKPEENKESEDDDEDCIF